MLNFSLQKFSRSLVLAAFTVAAVPAMASSISVTNVAFSDGSEAVSVSGAGTFNAGRFSLTTAAGTTEAWCVDLYRSITVGNQTPPIVYTLTALNDAPTIDAGPFTADQVSRVTGLAAYGNAQLALDPGNSVISAAVQGAIWGTVRPGATVSSGNAAVAVLLSTLQSTVFNGFGGYRLANLDSQNLLGTQTLFTGGTPVPLPGALPVFAMALFAGFMVTRRRNA